MNFATWRNCQLLRNDIDDATWWGRDTREVRGEGGGGRRNNVCALRGVVFSVRVERSGQPASHGGTQLGKF
jgi:hypothetical protein